MELPDFLSRKGRVEVDGYTDCWVWQKCSRAPYRRIYEALYGKVDNAFDLHHNCMNPKCVNPDHLVVLTPKEHGARHSIANAPSGNRRGPKPPWRH